MCERMHVCVCVYVRAGVRVVCGWCVSTRVEVC